MADKNHITYRVILRGNNPAPNPGNGGGDVEVDWSFNWDRKITGSFAQGTTIGGTDLKAGIEKALFPFKEASISIDGLPLQMTGNQYAPNIKGQITMNSESTIYERRVVRTDGGIILTKPVSNTINYTAPAISSSASYRIEADTENNGIPKTIASATETVEFVYPFMWGMHSDPNLSGTNLFNAFAKQTQKNGEKSVTYNDADKYIYFCQPFSYPELTSILDPNNFQFLKDFTKSTRSVTSTGLFANWAADYRVYILGPTTVNNGTFKFK